MNLPTLSLVIVFSAMIIIWIINEYYPEKLPYIKRKYFYIIIVLIAIYFTLIAFWPYSSKISHNETIYYSSIGFEINQFAVFAAFFVGILAVIASIYNTNKNYKSMKLSSIPEKSLNMMIDLEFLFNEYELNSNRNEEDEFRLLIEILSQWRNHQKAFRLLTPHFYKKFIKSISNPEIINDSDEIYEKNAKYIINAILTHITIIALENKNENFYFIKPPYIKDEGNIKLIGECELFYAEFEFDKSTLYKYINEIEGKKTKECCEKKFKTLSENIKNILTDLKNEVDEY